MHVTESFKQKFFQECEELLADLEDRLAALNLNPSDSEAMNAAFRDIHTIKGGAGMFGFQRLVGFSHILEDVMDRMRSGRLLIGETEHAVIVQACDILSDLVSAIRNDESLPEHIDAEASEALLKLIAAEAEAILAPPMPIQRPSGETSYAISFRSKRELLLRANEPILIFKQLQQLGTCTIVCDTSGLPSFASLESRDACLSWKIRIEGACTIDEVKECFEFVLADCDLEIVEEKPAERPVRVAAIRQTRRMASIRVDLDRIDKLVNLVGEITISQAAITQQIVQTAVMDKPQMAQEIAQLVQLTQMLQDSVMAIRAVPVGQVFARMPRLIRELSAVTGKRIRLVTTGEQTEIDKTVVEELGDPLLHILRNAADHGLERPEERIAAGKPPEGCIEITALQRGGQILIEVNDDGRGIDPQKVLQKALEQKLVSADAQLSNDEIINLIFLPGFSTADQVTDLSGRGVGMDVVKRNIQKLGGRIAVRSEIGRGTKLTLTLPLTLAILPGMIIRVGLSTYVVPLSNVVECLTNRRDLVHELPGQGEVFRFRDSYIPFIRLARILTPRTKEAEAAASVIIVEDEIGRILALSVDEIAGQQQVVIKSIRENLDPILGLAGATILGDGSIALILILSEIFQLHRNHPHLQFSSRQLAGEATPAVLSA
jgi:two-component system chemotaxis sensor kinase CheA